MMEAVEVRGPARARSAYWLGKGWDWFVQDPGGSLVVGLLAVALLTVTQSILLGPVMVGLAAVAVRRFRMGRFEIADFFQGFRLFLPALLSGLLVLAFTIVGLVFLIVPGLVIFSMYLFTFHFIFDQNQDFWEAMESSRKVVARDYFGFTVFVVLIVLLNLLGIAFLYVGTILTVMVTGYAITAAYVDCTEGEVEVVLPAPPSAPVVIE